MSNDKILKDIGYLIAKVEDTNAIVKEIKKEQDKKAEKETVKEMKKEVVANTEYRISQKSKSVVYGTIAAILVTGMTSLLKVFV